MKPFNRSIKATTKWQRLIDCDKRRCCDDSLSRRAREFDDACNVVIQLTKNTKYIKTSYNLQPSSLSAAVTGKVRRVISLPTTEDDGPNEGIKGNESGFSAFPSFLDDDDAFSRRLSHSCCSDSL